MGGTAIVLFWRGVRMVADAIQFLTGSASLGFGDLVNGREAPFL